MNRVSADLPDAGRIIGELEALALEAGSEIDTIRQAGYELETKPDSTPVTRADRRGEEVILAGLHRLFPGICCVAEEEVAAGRKPDLPGNSFFLVDALDGTREFISARPDFTVNIALVRNRVPVAGVVFAPLHHRLYSGYPGCAQECVTNEQHAIVSRRPISVRKRPEACTILCSRSHATPQTTDFVSRHREASIQAIGSSLKFCLIARGDADLYPRFGRTMEWDTAAGDAIVRAAGGSTRLANGGTLLEYGKYDQPGDASYANPDFICSGSMDGG